MYRLMRPEGTTAAEDRSTAKIAWHSIALPALLGRLPATEAGLSAAEAAERLDRFGRNQLPEEPPPSWWAVALRQFRSPLIYVLAAAAVVSLAVGEFTDAAFILAVLILNALIGGYQEWRAEKSTRALRKLLQIRATVIRDHEAMDVDAEVVVPGDVVLLESGNRVPADVRLLSTHGFELDESLLTGESLAVAKDPAVLLDEATPAGDHKNMAYAGALVLRGRAKGVVVATAASTLVGQLALTVIEATGGKPPLLERLERFARAIAYVVLITTIAVVAYGVFVRGDPIADMFLFGVALAVSAIPEGLPVAMTVALALATTRMARRGVIVRRLAAVEGLGSCTTIASDKTGTLTCNELTVRQVRLVDGSTLSVTGEGFPPVGGLEQGGAPVPPEVHPDLRSLARAAVLCNEADLHLQDSAWVWRGDPTDVALLTLAHKLGVSRQETLDRHPEVAAIPFEPEQRFAATFHRLDGELRVYVKGAPERVLAMCDGGTDAELLSQARTAADAMATEGFRVLALAEGTVAGEFDPGARGASPAHLRLLGLVGMIDPLRPGAKEAVAACRDAGITVCMVTGDHPVTALAIARELGFATRRDQVVTGTDLAAMSPEDLVRAVSHVRVFARVAPDQKLRIVEAARAAGHFVAVTGDGINDAPALRTANIGVAMGKAGTDIAREAAELVISDDNFATIVAGVEEGRVAYDNIRKVIYLLVSTGAAEVLMVALAIAAGMPIPLLPVQLLWLNLVTNGIQDVALAFEPSEGDVLARPPRSPREPIFNRLMIERTVLAAAVMSIVAFAAFLWMLRNGWSQASARNAVLLLMVLFENVHIGNCRSETKSALQLSPLKSPILLAGVVCAFLVHVFAMHSSFGRVFLQTEPVAAGTWAVLAGLALTIFVAMEIHKSSWRRRRVAAAAAPQD
jgi:Ca2+-transporting ATPase